MVFGVCRRVLHDGPDAEDAFQATFLALAAKAASVRRQGSVGSWLYRVAHHTALKALARAAIRRRHEQQIAEPGALATGVGTDPLAELTARELLAALDEELQRLPEKHRAPMVLCYLEGKTRDEAARQLGWTLRTLKRRLEQAKASLRQRLGRRDVALPAALLALGVAGETVPPALAAATARAALRVAAGQLPAAASVAVLMREGVASTLASKAKLVAALVLLVGIVAGGTRAYFWLAPASEAAAQEQAKSPHVPALVRQDRAASQPDTKAVDAKKAPVVTGRVLNAEGKPIAGARVAGLGYLALGRLTVEYRDTSLRQIKTDADGRFRMPFPEADAGRIHEVQLLASADGCGLAWRRSREREAGVYVAERWLGADRRTSGGECDLERCDKALRVAEPKGGEELSLADGSGVGVCLPGRHHYALLQRRRRGEPEEDCERRRGKSSAS
jgi:RNA polymerase sigma factor (sigma-70 family)